ncbi:MAG: cupin domain-containing protein [Chthoniobacterales bacterium]
MLPKKENLFTGPSASTSEEQILPLFKSGTTRIERIASHGHASPSDFWYDQENPEWVLLLEGSATLEFPNKEKLELEKGDYLLIPSHKRHRVQTVSSDAIWLAIHL